MKIIDPSTRIIPVVIITVRFLLERLPLLLLVIGEESIEIITRWTKITKSSRRDLKEKVLRLLTLLTAQCERDTCLASGVGDVSQAGRCPLLL